MIGGKRRLLFPPYKRLCSTIDAEFISVSRDNRIVEKPETVPFGMDIVIELNNSIKILEDLLKSHVEVEIQIENNVIYYLQVRKLL